MGQTNAQAANANPFSVRLSDEELRAVLARAEEIERGSRRGDAVNAEFNAVVEAGVAVGLARNAIEQALRERGDLLPEILAPGDRVFAQSADGNFYPADVVGVEGRAARVRFLRGSEHAVALDQVRRFSMIPGERVVVNWPWWGEWTCTVVSYDAARQKVKVYDGWGEHRVFNVAEVWWAPPKRSSGRAYHTAMLLATGSAIGALIGGAMMALFLR